ncbi:MAG: DegT/DnrJ/EryC1/StrS family aminotransferase [Proteobacteria bacterium]|nr:DegT/DnrJ/EryC1/StrS family aminotransferase [Pseudomonadota bacterium]
MKRIPLCGPSITDKEIAYVTDAAANAWYENATLYQERFEAAFAEYVGKRHAIAVTNCTSAIHLSLAALGVGPGDEVIVPDVTWIASAAPISYVGAAPVFADIDAKTWCLTAETMARCITERTKAVIPVDLYGNMAEMDGICELAERHGIAVIEDAAEAVGSEYHGKLAGSFGHTGVFSFHGSKTITTGEGGMAVTDDEALYRRMVMLRDHGRKPGDTGFFNAEVGFKYRMSGLQAALGLAQIERIEELVAKKRWIFSLYRARLGDVPGLTLNHEGPETKNTYWMVTVIWERALGVTKEDVIALMAKENIDTRPFFHPLSSIPAYADAADRTRAQAENEVSYALSPYGINLPSGATLTEEEIDYVCAALLGILGAKGAAGKRQALSASAL